MKTNFDAQILDAAGNPSPEGPDSDKPATLGFVAVAALFSNLPGDDKLSGTAKAAIGNLGIRLHGGGEQEITPEDAVTIRERVAKICPPLIVARVYELLG